jgi:hypothetical protein
LPLRRAVVVPSASTKPWRRLGTRPCAGISALPLHRTLPMTPYSFHYLFHLNQLSRIFLNYYISLLLLLGLHNFMCAGNQLRLCHVVTSASPCRPTPPPRLDRGLRLTTSAESCHYFGVPNSLLGHLGTGLGAGTSILPRIMHCRRTGQWRSRSVAPYREDSIYHSFSLLFTI